MIFPKLIGFLILLLSCSSGFSFSHSSSFAENAKKQISFSAELEEGVYYFSESILAAAPGFSHFKLADFNLPDFRLTSLNEDHLAELYMSYSVFIQPALDTSGIIFPFHFFL